MKKGLIVVAIVAIAAVLGFLFLSESDGQTVTRSAVAAPVIPAVGDPNRAPDEAVKGNMNMTFNTGTSSGTQDGAPRKGIRDIYSVDLVINGNRTIQGNIARQPRIRQLGIRTIQQPQYDFDLKWIAPVEGKLTAVGNWVGVMPTNPKDGSFILDGAEEPTRALKISMDNGPAVDGTFSGRFFGKAEDKSKLSMDSFKRAINGKTIEYKYKADPLRFDGMSLGEGPDRTRYPRTVVTGNLDYDRATGNYFAKNLRFSYPGHEDTVSGTIKWIEDPQRTSNGKGRYDFNIRFNEELFAKPPAEDKLNQIADEDAIFAIAKGIPSLTGTIDYQDSFSGSVLKDEDGKSLPTNSKAVYNLKATDLSKQQVMNFMKTWLVAVGPTNDE